MTDLSSPPDQPLRRASSREIALPINCAILLAASAWFSLPTNSLKARGLQNLPVGSSQQKTGAAATPAASPNGRTKIAQGEYELIEQENSGAVGPFGEEIYNFHETWALWRVPGQRYEVVGERQYESPKDVPGGHRFLDQLSRDLTVLRITDYGKLRWNKDSGPLTCEFKPAELHCASGARDPKRDVELNVPAGNRPVGLLWPISVFSISGLARQAERDPERPNPVRMISITQPSTEQPIYPEILDGQLQYLGEEDIQAAGVKWEAHKFSFHMPTHPEFLLWTSPKGFLLALSIDHGHTDWRKEGLRLVRFEQFAEF